ncbi:hypothetical protein DVA67_015785 [Solirubrobacter sp. CPCC 204708]|uniref:Class I SAM-dependent methyltransferase n=1 Tax=Solirubrobacter deserti TaxID=2282478 RepID=A0ABT4RND5_9ACTN|nr:methyltransferase domain-containing protein [Solirubrobacter deserti]MBE2317444.1 hypothetical protein [Solirubrobacter deserti]MDA0140026.1 class I SAM-dependent methyltransferase [Solirubrobacter deserti]
MSDALESHLHRQLEQSREFFWQRVRWRAVREFLPAGGPFTFVDVGAGIGLAGHYLREDRPQAQYRFVEPLESLVTHLEAEFGREANLNAAAHYDGAGYLALLDVLEHQENDFTFMAELAARMDPGATIVVTVPALPSLWSGWDTALGHYRRYRKNTLRAPIEAAGLRVQELSYLFPEMIPAGLLRKRRRAADVDQSAEFPDLPPLVNQAFIALGSATSAARKVWPAGTSVIGVAVKP